MREVEVVGVRVEMPSNQPIVLLREADGGALPADLDRRRRGHRDRLRPAGRRAAAAADPRPAPRHPRGDRQRGHRDPDHRDARQRLLRLAGARLRRRGQRPPLRLDRARAAHRRRGSSAPRSCSTTPGSSYPTSRRTRWRSSASSSTTSRPRTSTQGLNGARAVEALTVNADAPSEASRHRLERAQLRPSGEVKVTTRRRRL